MSWLLQACRTAVVASTKESALYNWSSLRCCAGGVSEASLCLVCPTMSNILDRCTLYTQQLEVGDRSENDGDRLFFLFFFGRSWIEPEVANLDRSQSQSGFSKTKHALYQALMCLYGSYSYNTGIIPDTWYLV